MKQFAKDNLCYLGGIIRKGDELPADVPAHLLDHWHGLGAIADVPVVDEPPPAEPGPLLSPTDGGEEQAPAPAGDQPTTPADGSPGPVGEAGNGPAPAGDAQAGQTAPPPGGGQGRNSGRNRR